MLCVSAQNDGTPYSTSEPTVCRVPVKLSPEAADGLLNTADTALVSAIGHKKSKMADMYDCTWEIFTDQGRDGDGKAVSAGREHLGLKWVRLGLNLTNLGILKTCYLKKVPQKAHNLEHFMKISVEKR